MNPKTFACPYHYHEKEEELMIVLEGEAIVRKNGEFRKVKAGDLVYYETGPASVHQLYNHTDQPFQFFVLSIVSKTKKIREFTGQLTHVAEKFSFRSF